MTHAPAPGRLLSIDHGLKVIGLALCDPTRMIARPLQVLHRRSKKEDFAQIQALINAHDVTGVIVGLPESPPEITVYTQADRVRRWAARLATAISIPVYLWTERYSTQDAAALLAEAGQPHPKRIDAVAAAVILQTFLDAQRDQELAWPAPVVAADDML